jgi:hypothetical protein
MNISKLELCRGVWGDGCAMAGVPSVYARVSSALSWIAFVVCDCWGMNTESFCGASGGNWEVRPVSCFVYFFQLYPNARLTTPATLVSHRW